MKAAGTNRELDLDFLEDMLAEDGDEPWPVKPIDSTARVCLAVWMRQALPGMLAEVRRAEKAEAERAQANARVAVLREAVGRYMAGDKVVRGAESVAAFLQLRDVLDTTDAAAERLLAELRAANDLGRSVDFYQQTAGVENVPDSVRTALQAWRRARGHAPPAESDGCAHQWEPAERHMEVAPGGWFCLKCKGICNV